MTRPRKTTLVVVSLALAFLAASLAASHAAAADVNITLYGSRTGGWGFTNTTESIPGPPLVVTKGDNVTMYLNGTDGRNHVWYIDYNNNSKADAGEPTSPVFNSVQIKWNFTANRNGTYRYRSTGVDGATMWGNITTNNPGTTPPGLAADNTVLIVTGVVIIIVAVLAVAAVFWRRMQKVPPPPPNP